MNLFELSNWKLQIQPEAYALSPFKVLVDRDKSKNKDKAIKELSFIFYMVDYKSDFLSIVDDLERKQEVCKSLDLDINWEPDGLVQKAMDFYKKMSSTLSLTLLEDARGGISKLSAYLKDISFDDVEVNERTGEVKPKHDIKKFADTIRQIPAIINALKELEEAVKKEQESEKGLRGGRQKGLYVDE